MRTFVFVFSLMCSLSVTAKDGPAPGGSITSIGIGAKVVSHYMDYTHYQPIGMCMWLVCAGPFCSLKPTPEVSEYLPDLIVTVATGKSNNPWVEANKTIDKAGFLVGNFAIKKATGFSLTNGSTSTRATGNHSDSIRTKSVDVVGNPSGVAKIPYLSLRLDAKPFMPYYQSDSDVLGRLDIAEALRPNTFLLTHAIGQNFIKNWGFEFPRSLTLNVQNDYKASVMAALHAADIVTNNNTLHTVQSTTDSCGTNCAVANVIEELKDDHEIVQEVYPHDKHVQLGQDDSKMKKSLGADDEAAGHGNYVFVFWRHYKGCVQSSGTYLFSTQTIPPTVKR